MAKSSAASDELRGDVLSVLLGLLEQGHNDAIVELVRKLLVRNVDLERRVAELGQERGHLDSAAAALARRSPARTR